MPVGLTVVHGRLLSPSAAPVGGSGLHRGLLRGSRDGQMRAAWHPAASLESVRSLACPGRRGAAEPQRMAPAGASSAASRASSAREAMPSLGKTLYRWYSTVRGLTNSCAAISRLVAPA